MCFSSCQYKVTGKTSKFEDVNIPWTIAQEGGSVFFKEGDKKEYLYLKIETKQLNPKWT